MKCTPPIFRESGSAHEQKEAEQKSGRNLGEEQENRSHLSDENEEQVKQQNWQQDNKSQRECTEIPGSECKQTQGGRWIGRTCDHTENTCWVNTKRQDQHVIHGISYQHAIHGIFCLSEDRVDWVRNGEEGKIERRNEKKNRFPIIAGGVEMKMEMEKKKKRCWTTRREGEDEGGGGAVIVVEVAEEAGGVNRRRRKQETTRGQ